jgi:glycosyltransferase involved in cell wall biosynthesis
MTGQLTEERRLIEDSGLFDKAWYLAQYPDVAAIGIDPVEHYLRIGALLRRQPGPAFDTGYYLDSNSDVASDGVNPLLHYLRCGRGEGRSARPRQKPAAAESGRASPIAEFPSASVPVNVIPGRRAAVQGAPTILVCAHVSGQHLFGSERSLIDILDGLLASGYNVITTVPGSRPGPYQDLIRDRSTKVLSFRYGWWRKDVALDEAVVATIAAQIVEHGIDAVHVNTIMLREPLAAARRMAIPGVVHVREIITHDQALCDLIGLAPEAIVDAVVASADHVVANSEATARTFAKPGATHVVPNTVDLAIFDLPREVVAGRVNVAMVSSNLPKKGLNDFVEVARRVGALAPAARFLLIGPDNEHVAALREAADRAELPGNLVFAGYRDDPVLAVAEADIVVNFSHFQESFGRTVLEAMAARRAVVAYDWGALGELIEEGVTGHKVPFGDLDAAAERIAELCLQPDRIVAMGAAGRSRAVSVYGKQAYAERLGQAYAAIFAQAGAGPREPLVLPARNGSSTRAAGTEGKLAIAYFLWHFPVPSETFVLNELRILVEQGHDVEVFCRQSPYKDFQPDFPIRWTRVQDPDDLAAKLLASGRQVVHSHFTYPTVTDMVWPACEKAGIDFTFIAHAQDIFRHANDERNRIGEIGRSPRCLRVLVPSKFHREYVISRGVPAAKVVINPNGIDPALYAAGTDPERAVRRRRSVCAIHRFTAKKGLEPLIRAGRELAAHGIEIHLYGYGELEGVYRSAIAELGLANVHLHGSVDGREAMLDVFSRHDLFACPSVRADDGDMDGIPTVLMEAMAAGMPVLTTAISGIPDLVQDGITGYVCDPTPSGIARAVLRFYGLADHDVQAVIDEGMALIRRDYHVGLLTGVLQRLWRGETIDLLIVSWNNLPQLQEVIRRLCHFTTMPFHLVVCDNDSGPAVTIALLQLYAARSDVTIVLNRRNAFVGPGTNVCLANSASRYAVYVCGKEGFVLGHGWERGLVDYMDANPKVGLAGTLCYSPTYLYGRDYPERVSEFPKFRNPGFATAHPARRFGHVQGGFFVIRRAMVQDIGGFSDDVPHNYTDVEYSYYAESCGWQLGQAPRLLALFNKTRPGLLSRIDDAVLATHPPTLEDLPLLDRIAGGEGAYCNVCGWHSESFEAVDPGPACSACGSTPADRSLFRFIAGSMLTYRRLPALGVDVGPALDAFWRQQFQGEVLTRRHLVELLRSQGRLANGGGRFKFACLRDTLLGDTDDALVMQEVDRLLADDGVLVIQGALSLDETFLARWRFGSAEKLRFASPVLRFDARPLYVLRRLEASLCVS